MSKPRKLKNISKDLTELLDNDELKVIEGSNSYDYVVMSPDTSVPICIECSGKVKNQGKFNKTYVDVVTVNNQKQFARLHYYFYKYLCLNEDCGALFQKPMRFASEKSRITRRYEDEVMKHVFYESIDKTIDDMSNYVVENHYQDLISKPAIGKLIKRWVYEKDERRTLGTPSAICIYTYRIENEEYTYFLDASSSDIKLMEIIPSITESKVKQFFSKVDIAGLRAIVFDCHPSVNSALKSYFPIKKVLVNTDAILYTARSEFDDYLKKRLKKYRKSVRELFLMDASEMIDIDYDKSSKMRTIRKRDTQFGYVFDSYSLLYVLLHRSADVAELVNWELSLDDESKMVFAITTSYIDEYSVEIANYQSISNGNDDSYSVTKQLAEKIEKYFPKSTEDVYRGRLLYCDFENNKQEKIQPLKLSTINKQIEKIIKQEDFLNDY